MSQNQIQRQRVFLLGLLGAGKTTIGAETARKIGWHFYDLDTQVAAELAVPEELALVTVGEQAYRKKETEVFSRWLKEPITRPTLYALGAGTLDQAQAAADLQHTIAQEPQTLVVAMRTSLATLAERSGLNRPRSIGLGAPRAWLRKMAGERYQSWEGFNPVWVEVSDLPLVQAISQLEKVVRTGK